MKILAITFLISLGFASTAQADIFGQCRAGSPEWYSCETDSDCKVISDPCGWPWDSANIEYADQAQQCNIMAGAVLDCVQYDRSMGSFTPKCIDNMCSSKKE